jgi:hypothetical protein
MIAVSFLDGYLNCENDGGFDCQPGTLDGFDDTVNILHLPHF